MGRLRTTWVTEPDFRPVRMGTVVREEMDETAKTSRIEELENALAGIQEIKDAVKGMADVVNTVMEFQGRRRPLASPAVVNTFLLGLTVEATSVQSFVNEVGTRIDKLVEDRNATKRERENYRKTLVDTQQQLEVFHRALVQVADFDTSEGYVPELIKMANGVLTHNEETLKEMERRCAKEKTDDGELQT